MRTVRESVSFANVMSVIAVFVALGGGAYAALSKNSVGPKQLKKAAVTTKKIKDSAVTAPKIAPAAVGQAQIAKGAVDLDQLAPAPRAAVSDLDSKLKQVDAASVNGAKIVAVDYAAAKETGAQAIATAGGLTISAECAANAVLTVTATSSKQNASIYTSAIDTDADTNNANGDRESATFNTGTSVDLLDGISANAALVMLEYDHADGTSVTGILATDQAGTNTCSVSGNLTAS